MGHHCPNPAQMDANADTSNVSAVVPNSPTGSTVTSSHDGSPRGTRLASAHPTALQQDTAVPTFGSAASSSLSLEAERYSQPPPNGIAEGLTVDSTSWMTISTATVDSAVPDAYPARRAAPQLPSAVNSALVPRARDKAAARRRDGQPPRNLPSSNRSRTISQITSNGRISSKSKKAYNSPAPPSSLISFAKPESTQVELRLEAYNLLNKDTLSLSDPFAVLYADHFGVGAEELGRTETVFDDLNPKFQTRFVFTYRASRSSNVIIELYDRDSLSEGSSLSRHDFLGRTEVDVAAVLDEPGGRMTLELRPAEGKGDSCKDRGVVSIFAEVLVDPERGHGVARRPRPKQQLQEQDVLSQNPQLLLTRRDESVVANDLSPGLDGNGRPRSPAMQQVLEMRQLLQNSITRPGVVVLRVNCAALKRKKSMSGFVSSREVTQFFELQRKRAEARGKSSWTTIYRSEDGRRINGNGYVEFKTAALNESAIHNGQPRRELRFVFYRRNLRTSHDMVCYAQASLAELVSDRRGGSLAAVPLSGQYMDDEGLGAMQIVGIQRDPTRDDTIVLDLSVDIFMPRGYSSSLMESHARQKTLGGGVAGFLQRQISLH